MFIAYDLHETGWEEMVIRLSVLDRGLLIAFLGLIAVLTIVQVAVLVVVFVFPMKDEPEFNCLQIDQSGLNYSRHGKSRFWAWHELSGIRLVSRYDRIEFVLPVADLKAAKHDPWVHGITPRGPIVVIKDVYDASLDEIVATLNAFRQQAIE